MPPRSFLALLGLLTLLVVAAPVAVHGASSPAPASPGSTTDTTGAIAQETATTTATTQSPDPAEPRPASHTTMRLRIQPDGDARWRVSATFPIRDANDSAAFDELVSDFDRAESPLGLDTFKLAANEASTSTGRDMVLRNITRSHFRENGTGTLVLSFTWSNFARVNGDRLAVGDAFNTTDGTWLHELPTDTTLIIGPPEGYGVSDAPQVGIVGGAARWDGPYVFDGPEPWIVYSGDAPTPTRSVTPEANVTVTTNGTGPTPGTETPSPGGPLSSALPILVLVAVAGVIAAVLAVYVRSDDEGFGGIGPLSTGGNDDQSGGGAAAADEPTDVGPTSGNGTGARASTTTESADNSAAAADDGAIAGAGSAAAAAENGEEDEVDEALLSDEERVERLLERNGGRMKQANIVKETGWSNAKVSQLLSAMAEDERIDKLRIGRENLISFPDEDVTDIDSE